MAGIFENQALQLFLISFFAVFVQNLVFKKLSDQVALRELKKQLESAQARMKDAQKAKDVKKMEEELGKVNEFSMKRLSLTMKPNLISSLAFILIFGWVQSTYKDLVVSLPIPLPVLHWKFPLIFLEPSLTWFWWYFYIAIISSVVVRDLLGIEI